MIIIDILMAVLRIAAFLALGFCLVWLIIDPFEAVMLFIVALFALVVCHYWDDFYVRAEI